MIKIPIFTYGSAMPNPDGLINKQDPQEQITLLNDQCLLAMQNTTILSLKGQNATSKW